MPNDLDDYLDDDLFHNYAKDMGKESINVALKTASAVKNATLIISAAKVILILILILVCYIIMDYMLYHAATWEVSDSRLGIESDEQFYDSSFYNDRGYMLMHDYRTVNGRRVDYTKYAYWDQKEQKQKIVSFNEFVNDAGRFYTFCLDTDYAIDKNLYLFDDSAPQKILTSIVWYEYKRMERKDMTYDWISKDFKYGVNAADWGLIDGNTLGTEPTEEEKARLYKYQWLPSNVWDTDTGSELNWTPHSEKITLYRNDIEGELAPPFTTVNDSGETVVIDEQPRFQTNWQTIFCILAYYANNLYEKDYQSGWGYDGNTSDNLSGKGVFDKTDMEDYYMDEKTIEDVVGNLAYTFEFYTDMGLKDDEDWNIKNEDSELYKRYRKGVEGKGFIRNWLDDLGVTTNTYMKKSHPVATWIIKAGAGMWDSIVNTAFQMARIWKADKEMRENTYSFKDLENYSYRIEMQVAPNYIKEEGGQYVISDGSEGDVAWVKKIPERAPKNIYNIFESYEYEYLPSFTAQEDGLVYGKYECTGRTHNIDGMSFYNYMKGLCPLFNWDDFIYLLSEYPGAEGQVEQMKALKEAYEYQKKTGADHITKEYNGDCISKGVIIGKGAPVDPSNFRRKKPPIPNWEDVTGVKELAEDWVFLNDDRGHYGWTGIDHGAKANNLAESDNLTKDEIAALLQYAVAQMPGDPGLNSSDTVDALYRWQENGGGSITGVFGIMRAEGTFRSTYGWKYYNWGNVKASPGDSVIPGSNNFKDLKAMGYTPAEGLITLFNFVTTKYWHAGQNTYYSMSMHLHDGTLYSAQDADEAAAQTSALSHCYCPYWDSSIETTETREDRHYYSWYNNCNSGRNEFLSVIGR